MAVTILEALWNAKYNLENQVLGVISLNLAKDQLNNAYQLLDKGYGIHEEVEPILEQYNGIENVPDKDED